MNNGYFTTVFIILIFSWPLAVIIAYSLGIEHGKSEKYKIPNVSGWISNKYKSEKIAAYVPSRDPERIAEGKEFTYFN